MFASQPGDPGSNLDRSAVSSPNKTENNIQSSINFSLLHEYFIHARILNFFPGEGRNFGKEKNINKRKKLIKLKSQNVKLGRGGPMDVFNSSVKTFLLHVLFINCHQN